MNDRKVFTRGVPPPEVFPTRKLGECFDVAVREDPNVVLQYGHNEVRRRCAESSRRSMASPRTRYWWATVRCSYRTSSLPNSSVPAWAVFTEQPSYDRATKTFRRQGAIGIPLEEAGISVARLETALEREVPAFLYLVQDFQNPAGATLLFEKRPRVVELANRHGFWVIEDVPYRKLRYRGEDLPLLREIDPSCVITMSSFSKLLSPGIRVGFRSRPPD
jgi:2-aminoadipate transaminase